MLNNDIDKDSLLRSFSEKRSTSESGSNLADEISGKKAEQKQKIKRIIYIVVIACILVAILLFAINQFSQQSSEVRSEKGSSPLNLSQSSPREQDRERFKFLLNEYETTLAEAVESSDFVQWNFNEVSNAKNTINSSMQSFAKGDYEAAVKKLSGGIDTAKNLLKQWNSEFDVQIEKTNESIGKKNIEDAASYLESARRVKPSDPSLATLSKRIEGLAALKDLYNQLNIAGHENNIETQIELLTKIVTIDPSDLTSRSQLDDLILSRNEIAFSSLIEKGLIALDNSDLLSAQDFAKQAANIFSNKTELKTLESKINLQVRAQKIAGILNSLQILRDTDDWASIELQANQSIKKYPNVAEINNYAIAAKDINSLYKKLTNIESEPVRLRDANISQNAQSVVEDAELYLGASPSLDKKISDVKLLLTRFDKEHKVTIISDNKTRILVKGVGTILPTSNKTITLKEGRYTLIAGCEGSKSKIFDIEVSLIRDNIFTVVCNE